MGEILTQRCQSHWQGPREDAKRTYKKDQALVPEQAGELREGFPRGPGTGGQVELGPWLALAKGTPGSWPTEGVGLVRGSPQIPLRSWGQADPGFVRSAPKRSLNGKNGGPLTSHRSLRAASTFCALAVVWVPKRVLSRQVFPQPSQPTED